MDDNIFRYECNYCVAAVMVTAYNALQKHRNSKKMVIRICNRSKFGKCNRSKRSTEG